MPLLFCIASQMATFFTFISANFFLAVSIKCLPSIAKLRVKIVARKIKGLILLLATGVFLMGHSIVASISIPSEHKDLYHKDKKYSRATSRAVHKIKVCEKFLQLLYNAGVSAKGGWSTKRLRSWKRWYYTTNGGSKAWKRKKKPVRTFWWKRWRMGYTGFLTVDTLERNFFLEKLDNVFDNLKCAPELNVLLGFMLKNVEDENC